MRNILAFAAAALAVANPAVVLADAPTTAAPAPAKFSVEDTDLGTLLDNPGTKAILVKYVNDMVSNPQIDMARSMTLKQLQQYAGDTLTDAKLAMIEAELSKLPTK